MSKSISLLLHLYQPPMQTESVFRRVTKDCYIPLIRKIKNDTRMRVTLNMPLSLLEQFEKYEYHEILSSIKVLYDSGRVELVGTAAYHSLLPWLTKEKIEQQIILNEFSLGHYFGRRSGFEGEDAVMVRNLNGFFPPEMAISENLVKEISELNYSWVIVDEPAVSSELLRESYINVFSENPNIELINRDKALSDILSFKRDIDVTDLIKNITGNHIIALDGETFGHHYRDGLALLEVFFQNLESNNIEVLSIDQMRDRIKTRKIEEVVESTWAVPVGNIQDSSANYLYWYADSNENQKSMKKIQDLVNSIDFSHVFSKINKEEVRENTPVWKVDAPESRLFMAFVRSQNSDKFWWLSNLNLFGGRLWSREMVLATFWFYDDIFNIAADLGLELSKEKSDYASLKSSIINNL